MNWIYLWSLLVTTNITSSLLWTATTPKSVFLDLKIFLNSDGSLGTSLFRKPSAENTILHATSSHPVPLKKSIPYSQYLRIRRNCSNEDFRREAWNLYSRLRNRGYSHSCLKKALNKTLKQNRNSLIYSNRNREANDCIRIITPIAGSIDKFVQF